MCCGVGYIAALVYGIYVFKKVREHMKGLYGDSGIK
jgi:hypothetical protein